MDEIESSAVITPDGNEGQEKNLISKMGKRGIILSIIISLLVAGGSAGYFYNYKVTQNQEKSFADGCFKLGLALAEDFDDYENGLYYPFKYFRNQTEHSQKYDSISNGLTDYRYLATQNSKYAGAKESSEILITLKERWIEFLKVKERRENVEESNPDKMEIGVLVRLSFNMSNNIFLYDYRKISDLAKRADKMYYGHFRNKWTTQDESDFKTAVSNYNESVTSLRSICGTARAGNR
jgi:hypothetical protein